jgi:hypothetical protein
MKTKSILFTILMTSILFASCNKDNDVSPSGNVSTVNKTITGYNELYVEDQFKVYVTFSDTVESIQIEANANLQAYISVTKQSNQLVIKLSDDVNITDGNTVLNIYITTKYLNAFYGVGAPSIELQSELIVDNLDIELVGAGYFKGSIDVDYLYANLIGASNLNLMGNSDSFSIEAVGGSNFNEYNFETKNLIADLEGGSNLYITVQNELDVNANGASNVYYKGDGAIVKQNLSGGSQIINMD